MFDGFLLAAAAVLLLLLCYLFKWPAAISIAAFVLFELALNAGPNLTTFIIPSLVFPLDIKAACAALNLTGLAGGAAVAGCCAQMVGFAAMSFKENKLCSILTAASSLVYGIFSFLEREKNYILAKASLIAAGILVVLWLAVIFIAL